MNNRYLICIVIAILGFGKPIMGQQKPITFKHLTLNDGLSESTVHAIYQDKNGFMWFGTDGGLDKFDGYEFTSYQHQPTNKNSIAASFIVSLYEDSYGTFWVGSGYQGLSIFDRKTEIFYHFKHNPNDTNSISNNNIRAIFEDRNKNLWVGTSGGGVNIYQRKSNTFIALKSNKNESNTLGSNYIVSLAEDANGNIWMGSTEGLITRFNPYDSTFFTIDYYKGYKGDLFNSNFGYVYIDSKNNVWFCCETGLFCYNQTTQQIQHYCGDKGYNNLNTNAVTSILELESNIFLVSTDHGGLNILDKNKKIITQQMHDKFDETTISNNQLYSIYKSNDGIIWIGSFRGGVNYYDEKAIKFDQLKYLLEGEERNNCCGSVTDIAEDNDGNIWVAYDGRGIEIYSSTFDLKDRIDTKSGKISLNTSIVTALHSGINDNIWIGTYLDGMYKYNRKDKTLSHFINSVNGAKPLPGNNVWNIIDKDENTLWIGTMGEGLGLFHKNGTLLNHFIPIENNPNSLSNTDVFIALKDINNNFWFGTRNGLNRYVESNNNFIQYLSNPNDSNSLYGAWVYEIFQDSEGILWIGTDAGLNKYQPETDNFTHYTFADGIEGNKMYNIHEDNHRNLWISTSKGITKFDVHKHTFRNYDESDGLQGTAFNYTTAYKDTKGRLYFGGTNGFNVFYPDSIVDNAVPPKIYITDFSIFNSSITPNTNDGILKQHINFTDKVRLTYKQSVITLSFAALNFTNTTKNKYKYMLQGFDLDWVEAGTKRSATYTNLNPGTYIFKVKASNNDGIWNEEPTLLTIEIIPPFWKTTWFIIVEICFLVIFILLFYYIRLNRLREDKIELTKKVTERTHQIELQKEELEQHRNHLEQIVESRTKELVEARDKAEESDKLKSAFLANMSHEIRTPMNAIVGFSKLLLSFDYDAQERNEFLRLINENADSLLRLIEDILDFSLIEADQLLIRKEVFSISELVDNIYSSMALSYRKSEFEVKKTNLLKNNNLNIRTDRFRLSQIILNLMSNACKFTTQGSVELLIEETEDDLIIRVKDTGIGIPKNELERIFLRFQRNDSRLATFRGVGLGLSISKQLSNLLGLSLNVESEEGKGSTFSLIMPLKDFISQQELEIKEPHKDLIPNWHDKKILIVEDENTNFIYLCKVLNKTNAKILSATNGEQALSYFEKGENIDLVLMDIRMPIMDGIEALGMIRKSHPTQLIIAQTAYARPEDVALIESAGFNDYIAKPIDINDLFVLIGKYF